MNTRSTFVVLVIALLLGGYFLVFETDYFGMGPTKDKPDANNIPAEGVALFDPAFTAEQVTRITLARPDEPQVVIERRDEQWRQTAPVACNLDEWEVKELIRSSAKLRYTNRIDPAQSTLSLATAGLEPARATVTLTGQAEDKSFEHVLKLGRVVAAGRAYLLHGDEKQVLVVGDALHDKLLDKSLTDLRARTLASPAADRVQSILLQRGETTIELQRGDAPWRVTKPYTARADRDAVDNLLNMPRQASIDSFIADQPDDLARYGLAKPSRILTLTEKPADNQTEPVAHRLSIGSASDLSGDKFFAMEGDSPIVFTLREGDVRKLDAQAIDLRSRRLVAADRANIQSVKLTTPNGDTVTLQRTAQGWAFGDPRPAFPPDEKIINEMLDALLTTESSDAEILNPDKWGDGLNTVTLTMADSSQMTLRISRGEKTSRVLLAGETLVQIADTAKLKPLFGDAAYFRNRTVWDITPEKVKSIAIRRTGDHPAEYNFTRQDGQWQLAGHDEDKFHRLLNQLAPLRAEQWQPVALTLTDFPVTVTLIDDQDKPRRLQIASIPMRIGLATGADSEFVLPKPLVDLLTGELRQTTAIDLEIEQIASVSRGDWTVERDENGAYTIAGEFKLDETKCGAMFDRLAGLQCEYWLTDKPLAGEPTHVLKIKQRKAGEHTLQLWIPTDWSKQKAFGIYDEGPPFELHRDTAERLIASPIQEPEK